MVAIATAQMTAEEFYVWAELPENAGARYELENGVPVEMPNPTNLHAVICWLVSQIISPYFLARGGFVATNDGGLLIRRRPDTVRGPDVAAFPTRPAFKDLPRGPATEVPSLVVEVLSPSDRPHRTTRRVKDYLRRGIPVVWTLEPDDCTVEIHTRTGAVLLEATDELVGDPELPGFRCPVAAFFSWPDAPPTPAAP